MRHTKGQNVLGDTESGIGKKKEFQKPVSSVGGRMSLEKFGFRPRLTSVDMNLSSIFVELCQLVTSSQELMTF